MFILFARHLIKKNTFDAIFEYTIFPILCSSLVLDSCMSLSNVKKHYEYDWPSLSIRFDDSYLHNYSVTAVAIMPTITFQTCSDRSLTCDGLHFISVKCSLTYTLFDTIWSWSALVCIAASDIAWFFLQFVHMRQMLDGIIQCVNNSWQYHISLQPMKSSYNLYIEQISIELLHSCIICTVQHNMSCFDIIKLLLKIPLTDHIPCKRCEVSHNQWNSWFC